MSIDDFIYNSASCAKRHRGHLIGKSLDAGVCVDMTCSVDRL